ncbi:MAG: hypothetical protein ACFFF4_07260 [Candidatus Thorarchaeota archaeon]
MPRHAIRENLIATTLVVAFLCMFILTPRVSAGNSKEWTRNEDPVPEPDMPKWAVQPQNQTVEYGDAFEYVVNITDGLGYWWFVSDTLHFRITYSPASDYAYIHSNGVLGIGEYYLKITVWDQSYDRLEAEIWITVDDTIYPDVTGPEDIEYTQGELNHNLTWVAYDANPYYYVITKSGGSIEEGHWLHQHQTFTLNLGFLPSGVYIYRLTVWDHGNNSMMASAVVHVRSNESSQESETVNMYERSREAEKIYYVKKPDVLFIEFFAIVILSGLTSLVTISAIATKKHEFGFD